MSIYISISQRVTWNKDQNHWEYTNTRYWPSEGSVDFYAFAPYSDQPKLVSPPNKNEPNPTCIYFPSNVSPVDLVWANAKDQTKTNEPVKFTFKHALARLGFDITANQDLEENGAVIKVKEVKLYGADEISGVFVMAGYLNLENGAWTLADNRIRWFYTWTPDGKVDGNENVNENDGTVLKLSAPQLDHEHGIITNDADSYIFIIPQVKYFPFYLQITYKVKQGDFEEEVTVRKNLLDVRNPPGDPNPSFSFEMGKAYVFHLKLSLDPIDFNVTNDVEPWKGGER